MNQFEYYHLSTLLLKQKGTETITSKPPPPPIRRLLLLLLHLHHLYPHNHHQTYLLRSHLFLLLHRHLLLLQCLHNTTTKSITRSPPMPSPRPKPPSLLALHTVLSLAPPPLMAMCLKVFLTYQNRLCVLGFFKLPK